MSVATLAPPAISSTDPVAAAPSHASGEVTVQEYLALERHTEIRHEYAGGKLIPMFGTTPVHDQIAGNLYVFFHVAFRDRECVAYMSDIRLRVSPETYRYPDVMALCGVPEFDQEKPPCLLNPAVIVEVLSPSISETDRSDKLEEYRALPSVTDYLIVATDRVRVTHYVRKDARSWTLTDYLGEDETLVLSSLNVALTLDDLYRKVVLPLASVASTGTIQSSHQSQI